MARIQIMHLPAPADEYPFVIIVDEVSRADLDAFQDSVVMEGVREATGARGVLVFPISVEVV